MSSNSNDKENQRSKNRTSSSGRRSSSENSARRQQQEASAKRNSILIIILSVVVVVAIAAGIIVHLSGRENSGTDESNASTGTVSESTISVNENTNALEENKYPEVNELIANYRKAFKEGDTELLKEVYNSDQEINADILTATSQIIEDYQNTQYYTKRGLNTGEYVVFVYDELKLANIETLAPNLSVFYVKPADDGTLYIYRGDYDSASGTFAYDEATQSYIDQLYQDEDVSELISTVNTRMDSACANDSDLMEFMQKVRSKTSATTSTSAGSESETDETAQTESGTETEETTESQSETEADTDADAA